MDLGKAISGLRKAYGMKKKDLADKAGLSSTALYNIEHNLSFPTKETIKKICDAFGIPVAFLMVYSVTEDDVPDEKRIAFRYLITPLKMLLITDKSVSDCIKPVKLREDSPFFLGGSVIDPKYKKQI